MKITALERFAVRLWVLTAVVLGFFVIEPVFAQTGCEVTEDGPVDTQKSGVKKLGDSYTVSWTAPQFLADADCTPIASDPDFALTGYEFYVQTSLPVPGQNFPPAATLPPTQTSVSGTVTAREDTFFAVKACNQYGCSFLSNQPWFKVGGPPGKPEGTSVN